MIKITKQKWKCVGRESNPGQLLGRQLCSPLYHRRHATRTKISTGILLAELCSVSLQCSSADLSESPELLRRLRGAMVARLTPDQKVACSNHVGVKRPFLFC